MLNRPGYLAHFAAVLLCVWAAATSHADEPIVLVVTGIHLTGELAPDGNAKFTVVMSVPQADFKDFDPTVLQVTRMDHTGRVVQLTPQFEILQSDRERRIIALTWTDAALLPGWSYTCWVEYSGEVYLCSNLVVIQAPTTAPPGAGARSGDGSPRVSPPSQPVVPPDNAKPELTVEARGWMLAVPDETLLVQAIPSEPGGTFRWESLTPSTARVVAMKRDKALVVSGTASVRPVFRVTYTLGNRKACAYFCPHVVDLDLVGAFSFHPDTPEEARQRADREAAKRAYEARLKTPEGLEDLRKLIRIAFLDSKEEAPAVLEGEVLRAPYAAQSFVSRTGKAGIEELYAAFGRTADGSQRARLVHAIEGIDRSFVYKRILPDSLAADDIVVCSAIIVGSPARELNAEMLAMLEKGLDSQTEYVRIMTCQRLAVQKLAVTLPRLEKVSARDGSPLVRFWADVACHAVRNPRAKFELPEMNQFLGPETMDRAEIAEAERLYPRVREEITQHGQFRDAPESASTQFRLCGAAIIPVLARRLAADDCSLKEAKTAGFFLRYVNSPMPRETTRHYARLVGSGGTKQSRAAFARYKDILENTDAKWEYYFIEEPARCETMWKCLKAEPADQLLALANLSLSFDTLIKEPASNYRHALRVNLAHDICTKLQHRDDIAGTLGACPRIVS